MYGTRKQLTRELKRAFSAGEPLTLLVWTTQSIASLAQSHGITETEAGQVLALLGEIPMREYQQKGVSFDTTIRLLGAIRSKRRPIAVPCDVLAQLVSIAERTVETEKNIAQDDGDPLPEHVITGLKAIRQVQALLAA